MDKWGNPDVIDLIDVGLKLGTFMQRSDALNRDKLLAGQIDKAANFYTQNPDAAPGKPIVQETRGHGTGQLAGGIPGVDYPENGQQPISDDTGMTGMVSQKIDSGVSGAADLAGYEKAAETRKTAESEKILAAKNRYADVYGKGGFDALRAEKPKSYADVVGMAEFTDMVRKTADYTNQFLTKNMESGKIEFDRFSKTLSLAKNAADEKNVEEAERLLGTAIDETHHPLYMVKKDGGKYDLEYREGDKRSTPYKDLSLNQVIDMASKITPEQFISDRAALVMDIQAKNSKLALNPIQVKKGKSEYKGIGVINPYNPQQVSYMLFDKNDNVIQVDGEEGPVSSDKLAKLGYSFKLPPSLDDAKAQADIAKTYSEIEKNRVASARERMAQLAQTMGFPDPDKLKDADDIEAGEMIKKVMVLAASENTEIAGAATAYLRALRTVGGYDDTSGEDRFPDDETDSKAAAGTDEKTDKKEVLSWFEKLFAGKSSPKEKPIGGSASTWPGITPEKAGKAAASIKKKAGEAKEAVVETFPEWHKEFIEKMEAARRG